MFGSISPDQRAALETNLGLLRARQGLYSKLQGWMLLGLTQSFAVAFNVSAYLTMLYLLTVGGFEFCWSTTMGWKDASIQSMSHRVSAPWSWIYHSGVPTEEMVKYSAYNRGDNSYLHAFPGGEAAQVELVQRWRSFLFAALIVYGLLPRLLALLLARWKVASCLASVRLDAGHFQGLYDRLTTKLPSLHSERRAAAPNNPLPAGALLKEKPKEEQSSKQPSAAPETTPEHPAATSPKAPPTDDSKEETEPASAQLPEDPAPQAA